jgi:hypothetical protein
MKTSFDKVEQLLCVNIDGASTGEFKLQVHHEP